MKKDVTELVIIIDKSGSMYGLEKDVVGGFNALIEEQKKMEGEVRVTTIFFDTTHELIHNRLDIKTIEPLGEDKYVPNGCTALLDAIGHTIMSFKDLKKKEENVHYIFSIMTDGLENSSKEFTYSQIKKMILDKKKEGWDFLFQGANIDAFSEGDKLGMSKVDISQFNCNEEGIKFTFCCAAENIKMKRKLKKKK